MIRNAEDTHKVQKYKSQQIFWAEFSSRTNYEGTSGSNETRFTAHVNQDFLFNFFETG